MLLFLHVLAGMSQMPSLEPCNTQGTSRNLIIIPVLYPALEPCSSTFLNIPVRVVFLACRTCSRRCLLRWPSRRHQEEDPCKNIQQLYFISVSSFGLRGRVTSLLSSYRISRVGCGSTCPAPYPTVRPCTTVPVRTSRTAQSQLAVRC